MKTKVTDLNALWLEVEAIPHPGPEPMPDERPMAPSAKVRFYSKLLITRRIAQYIAWASFCLLPVLSYNQVGSTVLYISVGAVGLVALCVVLAIPTEITVFEQRFKAAEAEWKPAEAEWEESAGPRSFDNLKLELAHTYSCWRGLGDVRADRMAELHEKHWYDQQHNYLSKFDVGSTKFCELARHKGLNLRNAGIRTAADVTDERVESLSRTNDLIGRSLIEWRHSLEAQFEFDPAQPMDPNEVLKVEEGVLAEGLELEIRFEHYLTDLRKVTKRIHGIRARHKARLEAIYYAYRQAEVNLMALKSSGVKNAFQSSLRFIKAAA
jgi:hypothetical protein